MLIAIARKWQQNNRYGITMQLASGKMSTKQGNLTPGSKTFQMKANTDLGAVGTLNPLALWNPMAVLCDIVFKTQD